MNSAVWPIPLPENAYVRGDGIVFYREEEEEPFTSDILSRHPECLAEPMALEYARLYLEQGEEKAEAYLTAISAVRSANVRRSMRRLFAFDTCHVCRPLMEIESSSLMQYCHELRCPFIISILRVFGRDVCKNEGISMSEEPERALS